MRTLSVNKTNGKSHRYTCFIARLTVAIFFMCLGLSQPILAARAAAGQPGKKAKKEVSRDPLISRSGTMSSLGKNAQAALLRSGKAGVLRAETATPGDVYEIRIEGAKKIEPDAVLIEIENENKHRIGLPLSKELLAQDVRDIFSMGLFTDISVEESVGPSDSVILTYRLSEKPTIHEIHIEGSQAITQDDIKEVIDLRAFHVADIARIRDNVEKIRKLYVDKGYFLAEVEYRVEKTTQDQLDKNIEGGLLVDDKHPFLLPQDKVNAPDFVEVTFVIREQPKIKIERIAFLGNAHISSEEIKGNMRSKENHPLGALTQWGTYSEEMLDFDLLLIEQLYQEHGFLNVQVGKPRVAISSDKTRISIHISITEGQQYRLGTLDIAGDFIEENEASYLENKASGSKDTSFLRSKLLERISLHPGEVFNRTQLARDILSINELYKDEGYAYVNITPIPTIHDEELLVDVRIEANAGPRVTIERIDIKGNNKTADEVIRREIRIYEGERYSSSLLKLSEQRISQTGFFETIKIIEKQGSQPDKMVIEIEVTEKSSGQINAGIGYGMGGEGIIGKAQISQNNLFGRGQFVSLQAELSKFRRIFDGRFVDPYLTYVADAPLMMSVSAYNTQRYMQNFSRGSTGGDLTFGYPIGQPLAFVSQKWLKDIDGQSIAYIPDFENLQFSLGYNLERIIVTEDNLDDSLFDLHINQPRYTTSIKTNIIFDQRNNRLFPTAGYLLSFGGEFAAPFFGSGLLQKAENAIILKQRQNTGIDGGLAYKKIDAQANLFTRYSMNARAYYNFDNWFLLKGWVLKFNIDMGILNTFNEKLIFENYAIGGLGTIRGYAYRSIGPVKNAGKIRNPNAPLGSFTQGGNKQFLTNIELEFPLFKQIGINGVFFCDMGNVFGPNENFFYIGDKSRQRKEGEVWNPALDLPFSLYASAGLGVRWYGPFGLVRFEWGFPLIRRPVGAQGLPSGDELFNFEFNIGSSF